MFKTRKGYVAYACQKSSICSIMRTHSENEDINKRILDLTSNNELLERIAVKRGCLKSGAEYALDKAARCLVDDFRKGRIGKISLEIPQ